MLRERKRIGMIGNKNGFTLMELIIVMAILAVLVTLALLYYGNVGQDAYRNALMADLKAVDEAVALYENKYSSLPLVETPALDLADEVKNKSTGEKNVPEALKVDGAVEVYPIDATNADFMSYIKKTSYLLKGLESGDTRGAGKLYYVNSVDDAVSGKLAAGSTGTTINLASGAATDDIYNGCTINITSGVGAGQSRVITDYEYDDGGPTYVVTVSSALAIEPAAGDDFVIKPPVKAGDIVFVQSATTDRLVIKDSSGQAIYKY